MWKVRDLITECQEKMRKHMPRMADSATVDETRIPNCGRAPCIRVITSKPIVRGWTVWLAVCTECRFV